MPASITISGLSWSTPDGRLLLEDLNLAFGAERVGLVGRNGAGKSTLLGLIARDVPIQSGTVRVTGRIGMLRQSVQPGADDTIADLFGVAGAMDLLRRAERGAAAGEELADADWSIDARLAGALARVGLDAAPDTRLLALSGGQRTRAGLAALLFSEPDFLLLDEPTNNLDREGRRAVSDLLRGWRAGAVVVSHDRELLDEMDAIVELTSLGATRHGGNWSRFREWRALELAAARRDLADAESHLGDVVSRAQATAQRKARKDGAGHRRRSQGGTPRILLNGQKNRCENTTGANARLAERRHAQATEAAAEARRRIEIFEPFSVTLAPTGLGAARIVLVLEAVSAGYEPGKPLIDGMSFDVTGPERIAVTGPNGAGKSSLLALVTGQLQAWTGSVRRMTPFGLLDQRVGCLDPGRSIRDNFLRLNPDADENACRAALARFRFRADSALQTVSTLSGGEMLRVGLACTLGGTTPPPLLLLDEPTNHLDLDSVEVLEAGLRAFDGALLIVSHDESFLEAVGITRRLPL
ncbi:ABC-F family ATP-binding cassette domain-containing protein [Emcibacter sp. SYSU 3D8]|uniref:ABC-F family ATP-binding cassette domain-containing protein n=1 Tax=Emcibacter sp. SYSU 3D8 TaxID=3133969 RepID=UPI0031FE7518